MNHIFVFGASCSGKSTVAETLKKDLGKEWTYVERDLLIESGECPEDKADPCLEKKIDQVKNRVIVDAQIPWREKKAGELYVLIQPPLDVLLDRHGERVRYLKLDVPRAEGSKEYVVETHTTLSRLPKEQFNLILDSSQITVEEEVTAIKEHLKKSNQAS